MKRLFQRWLLLFVGIAFLLTFISSYCIHSSLAEKSALELLSIKLDDAKRHMLQLESNLVTVRSMNNDSALAKARAFSRIIAANPSILKDRKEFERIKKDLDVDELHVSDSNGILIASIPQSYEGYNMANSKQSGEFINMLKTTSIVGYIAIQDLTKMSDIIRSRTYEAFFPLISTAIIYFAAAYLMAMLISYFEFKLDPDSRRNKQNGVVTKR